MAWDGAVDNGEFREQHVVDVRVTWHAGIAFTLSRNVSPLRQPLEPHAPVRRIGVAAEWRNTAAH